MSVAVVQFHIRKNKIFGTLYYMDLVIDGSNILFFTKLNVLEHESNIWH